MTLGFVDQNTIYGDEKFHSKLNINSWNYQLTGNTGDLNLYQDNGEHEIVFEFSDSSSGNYTWEAYSYASGSKVRYSGHFTVSGNSGGSDSGSTSDPYNDKASFVSSLQGKWTSACENGTRTTFEFHNETLYYTPRQYQYADCSGYEDSYPMDIIAEYSIGKETITESGVTAREIDITFTFVADTGYGVSSGDTSYDLIYVDGNSLYLGDSDSASGPSTSQRPTRLDFQWPLYRQ